MGAMIPLLLISAFLAAVAVTSFLSLYNFAVRFYASTAACETSGKRTKPAPWVEGRYTQQEREVFAPLSALIAGAEERAIEDYYGGPPPRPPGNPGISDQDRRYLNSRYLPREPRAPRPPDAPRIPQILPGKPRTSGRDWVGEQTRSPGGSPWTGDPREKNCTYDHQAGVYRKYVPGLGIVSALDMDKMDRAIEVVKAERTGIARLSEEFDKCAERVNCLDAQIGRFKALPGYGKEKIFSLQEQRRDLLRHLKFIMDQIELCQAGLRNNNEIRRSMGIPPPALGPRWIDHSYSQDGMILSTDWEYNRKSNGI